MPTARELIEQADALMRRNRPPVGGQADVVHASPMPPAEITPSEDAVGPEESVQATVEAAIATADDVPVLTEAVPHDEASGGEAADDVPVLTDAIEEIVAAPFAHAGVEAEISEWLNDDRRNGIPAGPFSQGGDDTTGPAREPGPEDNTEAGATAVPGAEAAEPVPVGVPRLDERGDERYFGPGSESVVVATRIPEPDSESEMQLHAAFDRDVGAEFWVREAEGPAHAPAQPASTSRPHEGDEIDEALGLTPGRTSPSRDDRIGQPPATPLRPATVAEPPATVRDDAEWAALAEEIRMQVLQRIDIFTDTGLREQLGQRLKPVVDRASADLVATINQHVGDLLRAYVAEAIEREIERWKHDLGQK